MCSSSKSGNREANALLRKRQTFLFSLHVSGAFAGSSLCTWSAAFMFSRGASALSLQRMARAAPRERADRGHVDL